MNKFLINIALILLVIINPIYADLAQLDDYIEQLNKQDNASIIYKKNAVKYSKEQQRLINYLNSIKTMVADFIQISPDGSSSEGQFFLLRPGKLRWQYNPPVPIQIIINGDNLIYYDYELNEATYTEVDQIMGAFLTAKQVDFSNEQINLEHEQKYGLVKLVVTKNIQSKSSKQNFKKMIMIFNNQPLELKKIEFIDNDNELTSVSFHNIKFNRELDKSLFTFKNPRILKQN